jgi:hypothetical protein
LRNGFWSSFGKGTVFRCLLTLVALFYVAQQLSVVAHLALVRHAVCDEHGELVDVDVARASEASGSSKQGSQESSSHLGHDHEHCGVLAHLRQQFNPPVFVGIPARVAALPDVAAVLCLSAPSIAIPVYCLAPKNSPPA